MKLGFKVWLLIAFLLIALLMIRPSFETGVVVKVPDETMKEAGLTKNEIIKEINQQKIKNIKDYREAISKIYVRPTNFTVFTDGGIFGYTSREIGFEIENLTIKNVKGKAKEAGIKENSKILEINGEKIRSDNEFFIFKAKAEPKTKVIIKTNKQEYELFLNKAPEIIVGNMPKSRLKTGLDITGGSRGLVRPEKKLTSKEMTDLIQVSSYRLNVYGVADIVIRPASDIMGNNYMMVEAAGVTPAELKELIGKQGKFEAKISNETIFIGGKKDIISVCRKDVSCERITCSSYQDGELCRFSFAVYLSEEAARRHAVATANLSVNMTEQGAYLSEKLDLYLDDKLVDSLLIAEELKGKVTTQVSVEGSSFGKDREQAYKAAEENMIKLQTILITGSLPFKLEIVKLDSISPALGKEFLHAILLAFLAIFFGVSSIIFFRYRNPRICMLMIMTIACETFLVLGFAAFINWNLDLPSIAGILAAIGTGIDDQIVIIDEGRLGRQYGWKERLRKAFFIIFAAFGIYAVSLLPLFKAGAGLLKGFALTTLLGIIVGIFITRPAFAELVSRIEE